MGRLLSELVDELQEENRNLKDENEGLKDKIQELQKKLVERPKQSPYYEDGAYEKALKDLVHTRGKLWRLAVKYLEDTDVI